MPKVVSSSVVTSPEKSPSGGHSRRRPRSKYLDREKKSWKDKWPGWHPWTLAQRRKDKKVRERFKELGYCPDPNKQGNYPCLCGQYPDDHCVWWMGGNFKGKKGNPKELEVKTPDHLFCLRCRKRVYEKDIADAINAWHEMKGPRATLRRALLSDE